MAKPNSIALDSVSDVDHTDIIISDQENPRALTNLVSEKFRDAIHKTLETCPQYFDNQSEHDLRLLLKPDDTVCRVRIAFWQEYFRAQDDGKKMMMSRVYSGVTSHDSFYGPILARPQNIAWIITPPVKYMLAMEEALNRGLHNLTVIMGMNLLDENGEIKPKAASIFLKAFEMMQERVKGSVIQKNLHITGKVPAGTSAPDMDALQDELETLRNKSKLLPATEIEATRIDEGS